MGQIQHLPKYRWTHGNENLKERKSLRDTYAENNRADRAIAAMHGVAPMAQKEITPKREYTRSDAPLESDIQAAIVNRLRVHPKVSWIMRVNSGTLMTDSGKSMRLYFLYLRGMPAISKGVSDIVGQFTVDHPTRPSSFFAFEVKRDHKQDATPEQSNFLKAVNEAGGIGRIVCSVEEAERAIA